jgi:hypothetical protein
MISQFNMSCDDLSILHVLSAITSLMFHHKGLVDYLSILHVLSAITGVIFHSKGRVDDISILHVL